MLFYPADAHFYTFETSLQIAPVIKMQTLTTSLQILAIRGYLKPCGCYSNLQYYLQ